MKKSVDIARENVGHLFILLWNESNFHGMEKFLFFISLCYLYLYTVYFPLYFIYMKCFNVFEGRQKAKIYGKNGNSYHFMLCFVEYVPLSGKYEKLLFAFTFVFRCYVWKNPRKNRFFP